MQPNQQYPPQNTPPVQGNSYVSPSGSNVPEFLHLDPIAEPSAPKPKKKLLIFLLAIIVVAMAGVLLYMYLRPGASQIASPDSERFYAALEKLMQVDYVHREYDIDKKNPQRSLSITADSDLSNPALPKSILKFTANMGDDGSGTKEYAGEYRIVKTNEYDGLLSSATKNAIPRGVELNQWYRFTSSSAADNTVFDYALVGLESRSTVNSSQGPFVIGNIKSDFRRQLMDLIKSKVVYAVTVDKDNTTDTVSVYTGTIDQTSVRELNALVAKLYGIQRVHRLSTTSDDKMQLWIDNNSGRITKVVYTNGTVSRKTVKLTYPASVDIASPGTVKDAPR